MQGKRSPAFYEYLSVLHNVISSRFGIAHKAIARGYKFIVSMYNHVFAGTAIVLGLPVQASINPIDTSGVHTCQANVAKCAVGESNPDLIRGRDES